MAKQRIFTNQKFTFVVVLVSQLLPSNLQASEHQQELVETSIKELAMLIPPTPF